MILKGKILTLWSMRSLIGIMSGLTHHMYTLKGLVGVILMRMVIHGSLLMKLLVHRVRFEVVTFQEMSISVQGSQMKKSAMKMGKMKIHMMMLMCLIVRMTLMVPMMVEKIWTPLISTLDNLMRNFSLYCIIYLFVMYSCG
ncbi:hypothetical protein GUJ93_ZPchr0013g36281 [Zizania palustris]|uniref:Uncharacterized protein n=1 Tax=Zizania palustris TaxID=103762 RepID=A0A8J5X593_ZIZPA|nr:hypothetical protein GUJ93_ZPchr0013g36281 [Zizania palustris]